MWTKEIKGIPCGDYVINTIDPLAKLDGTCGQPIGEIGWLEDWSNPERDSVRLIFAICSTCAPRITAKRSLDIFESSLKRFTKEN